MSDVKHTEERTETHACVCERTETHDLISRKAAIERIKLQMDRPDTFGWWTRNDKIAEACYKIAIEILERLPSAEPERKTGQWIIDGEGMLHCSACAEIPVNRIRDAFKVVYDIHPLKINYCPNCGVRMVGGEDG